MAVTSSKIQNSRQSYRRQALIWLVMTLVLGVITALVWMFNQTPSVSKKIENAPISASQPLSTELEQPLAIQALHELDSDVQPINFDATIRDLRTYPDEFKDKRYLLANKGKWTVQVMNVTENDVIVSYLEGRDDREKFAYFRYRNDENQLRYMLTYGIMSSPQEAVGAAKLIDFNLPANVRVLPEEINRYVSIIDVYERPEPIKDLSAQRARSVNLRPTKREVPPRRQAAPTESKTSTATSTRSNGSNSQENVNENSSPESIRQSEDTSATLSVSEERTIAIEGQAPVTPSTSKTEQSTQKPADASISAPKKPPVVATPKVPNSASSASSGNNSSVSNSTKPANSNANSSNTNTSSANISSTNTSSAKRNEDSIKELIEQKNN